MAGITADGGDRLRDLPVNPTYETNNELTYLDGPGSVFTNAWDVNPAGTVVGQYDAGGRTHGFFYTAADGFVSLDVPNSTMTVARGINPHGQIVGVYNDASGTHGFVTQK